MASDITTGARPGKVARDSSEEDGVRWEGGLDSQMESDGSLAAQHSRQRIGYVSLEHADMAVPGTDGHSSGLGEARGGLTMRSVMSRRGAI